MTLLVSMGAFAQGNGIGGITEATNMVTSYFDPGTKLIYAIGAVIGLIGGVKVYSKFSSGDNPVALATAYNQGADEGIRQAQAEGLLGPMLKVWRTSGDDAVCDMCVALDGTEIGMDDSFAYAGKLLFPEQRLLPPAHPRCACAVEYIESPVFRYA